MTASTELNLLGVVGNEVSVSIEAEHEWEEIKSITRETKIFIPSNDIGFVWVSGPPPTNIAPATVTMTATGRTYATGNDTQGKIRLTLRRSLDTHRYNLTLRTAPSRSRNDRYVRLAYRRVVVVPITLP